MTAPRRLAIVAVLFIAVLPACGGSKKRTALSRANVTTTTAPTATTAAPAGATTTTAAPAGGSTATTAAKKAAPSGINGNQSSSYKPPAGAQPYAPPAPGKYTYDVKGSSSNGSQSQTYDSTSTLTVDPPQGTKQHSTREFKSSNGSNTTEQFLHYDPPGVLIEELKTTTKAQGFTDVRDLKANPPALLVPTGAKPGDHVEFDLKDPQTNTNAHVVIDFRRAEKQTIGGQSIDTLVIDVDTTLSGSITGHAVVTSWVSPQYRLIVKDHSVNDAQLNAFAKSHSEYDDQLQKLTPS